MRMNPARKRTVRLVVALSAAVALASALIYTSFSAEDRVGGTTIPVAYTGTVPDPFREGREVIVTVQKHPGRFVGERDSLITKCPSKYKAAPAGEKQNF